MRSVKIGNRQAEMQRTHARSGNFGFLAPLEPLLVVDGVAAESYMYSDPDAAMVMARRFTESLAKELLVRTRIRMTGGSQRERVEALAQAGVLVPKVRDAFDRVRRAGNRAAHRRFGDTRAAVDAVRTCFELGCGSTVRPRAISPRARSSCHPILIVARRGPRKAVPN